MGGRAPPLNSTSTPPSKALHDHHQCRAAGASPFTRSHRGPTFIENGAFLQPTALAQSRVR